MIYCIQQVVSTIVRSPLETWISLVANLSFFVLSSVGNEDHRLAVKKLLNERIVNIKLTVFFLLLNLINVHDSTKGVI